MNSWLVTVLELLNEFSFETSTNVEVDCLILRGCLNQAADSKVLKEGSCTRTLTSQRSSSSSSFWAMDNFK